MEQDYPQEKELLQRYREGLTDANDDLLIEQAFNHFAKLVENEAESAIAENSRENIAENGMGDTNLNAIGKEIWEKLQAKNQPMSKKTRLWPRIAGVAAALTAITLGIWFYYTSLSSRQSQATRDLYANNIAAGRNTATLTLANGEVIQLDTNKTSVVVVDSVKTLTMLTASTPRGGTYQVVLPDGTAVWLNAASSIKFPSSFSGTKQRRISLEGEAYLEVAKDKNHPFIVESAGQTIEVLGTHFNVNAYPEEETTKTTLLEGSVKVSAWRGSAGIPDRARHDGSGVLSSRGTHEMNRGQAVKDLGPTGPGTILRPGQQSILTQNKPIVIRQIDTQSAIAWKNGEFSLDEMDFKTAMRQIARWYDVQVVYEDQIEENLKTGGWISRNEKLSSVLQSIERAGKIRFKISGRKVSVYNR